MPLLQAYTQTLQALIKQFEAQQQALMTSDAQALLTASQSADQVLEQWQQLQANPDMTPLLQPEGFTQLLAQVEAEDPTALPRLRLLVDMIKKQTRAMQKLHRENQALIQQAHQLNEAQLESLVTLHQNTQPVVYGAQGDSAAEFQASRSAYDFSA